MKPNTISIIVITLIIAVGAYLFFHTGAGNQQPLSASSPSDNPAQAQFQALVNELQPISFDTAIFSDPKFASLVSIETPPVPETLGRLDPFSPVSGVTGN